MARNPRYRQFWYTVGAISIGIVVAARVVVWLVEWIFGIKLDK